MKFEKNKQTVILVVIIISFAVFICFRIGKLLFQTPLAVGVDGYYYVLQIDTFFTHGHFYFSNFTPIVLLFLSFIRLITQDSVFAIKIGAVILHLFLSFGVFTLLKNLTKSCWFGFCGILCLNLSNLHLYFVSEFLNNLGALAFLVWGIVFFVKGIEQKKSWLFFVFFTFLLLSVFSHRSALPLILLISFSMLWVYLFLYKQGSLKQRIILFGIAFFVVISPPILAWQTFFALPDSLKTEFLTFPRLPLNQVALPESLALLLITGITLFLLFFGGNSKTLEHKAVRIALLAICLISLFLTLNPFLNHQTGFLGIFGRLMSLSYLQLALALPLLLFILQTISAKKMVFLGSLFLPFLIWSFLLPLPLALRLETIQKRENLVNGLNEIKGQLSENAFIVAPHGDQFVVTAVTGYSSQQKPPTQVNRENIYWLIYHSQNNSSIEFTENISLTEKIFSLVKDSVLREKMNNLSIREKKILIPVNPHLQRFLALNQ